MKWAFYSVMLYNRCSNPDIGTGVWPSVTESICNAGEAGLVPGSGRSPGRGHGNPLQCSYLENSMDRGAWRATVRRVVQSQRTEAA